MDDDYENLAVEFTLLPGVDLRLWLAIISVVAVALAVSVALALTVG